MVRMFSWMINLMCNFLEVIGETDVPGGNPSRHGERNIQTPFRKAHTVSCLNPQPECVPSFVYSSTELKYIFFSGFWELIYFYLKCNFNTFHSTTFEMHYNGLTLFPHQKHTWTSISLHFSHFRVLGHCVIGKSAKLSCETYNTTCCFLLHHAVSRRSV